MVGRSERSAKEICCPMAKFVFCSSIFGMDTNVKGVFFLTQKLLPLLRASGTAENPARVVNVGSIDGIKNPVFETFSYGPSKAALHHLTRGLALHLAPLHIIVNAIAPGFVETDMTAELSDNQREHLLEKIPLARLGQPEDIAKAVAFLVSDDAAYITGQALHVNGGMYMSS